MKICFVCLNIYPLFRSIKNWGIIGGTERQEKYIGKELQSLGYKVSYITLDHGQPQEENIDNFLFYKTFSQEQGLRFIKFFYPRIFKLWQAVKLANADVYYCRAAGCEVGVVAYFAKKYKKKIIYAGANNNDFLSYNTLPLNFLTKKLYCYGLKNANLIICQTKIQIELLKENYQLSGCLQPNVTPPLKEPMQPLGNKILWIAHIHKDKRPLFFLQLAGMLPEYEFIMIGGIKGEQEKLHAAIVEKSKKLKNFTYLGLLPFDKVEENLQQAKILVNASLREGFPNSYLQAWRRGIPVVTTFDPTLNIEKNKLGLKANNLEELSNKVKAVMENEIVFDREHIKNYCAKNYRPKPVVGEMAKRIQTLLKN